MAALRRLNRIEVVQQVVFGPERRLVDRQNPLEVLTVGEVFTRYRFRPCTILFLCQTLATYLEFGNERNSPLPVLYQVLVTLRFFATGSFQLVIGDLIGISQPSVSRICRRVARAICEKSRNFINFPRGQEVSLIKRRFRAIAGFPNVIGCVDGCQIKIQRPVAMEADYINRKGFHSLNVQMICDHSYMVRSLTAKWPGSTHDSRIWRECSLCKEFENGVHNGFIVGDSGYPCKPFLMTPFLNPVNVKQERFNASLCRTRVIIEQTFGIIKRRFPILQIGIRACPATAIKYITSCVVLHNIGIDQGDIIEHVNDVEDNIEFQDPVLEGNTGNHIRQQIANQFFLRCVSLRRHYP